MKFVFPLSFHPDTSQILRHAPDFQTIGIRDSLALQIDGPYQSVVRHYFSHNRRALARCSWIKHKKRLPTALLLPTYRNQLFCCFWGYFG